MWNFGNVGDDVPAAPDRARAPRRLRLGLPVSSIAIPLADILALLFAFVVAGWLSHVLRLLILGVPGITPHAPADVVLSRGVVFATLATVLMLWLSSHGHYRQRHSFWFEARDVALGCGIAALSDAFLQYAAKEDFSRLWLVSSWVIAAIAIPSMRNLVRRLLSTFGFWQLPVLVLGSKSRAEEIDSVFAIEHALGYRVMAFVPLATFEAMPDDVGTFESRVVEELEALKLSPDVRVVLAPLYNELHITERLSRILERRHYRYSIAAPLDGIPLHGLEQQYFLGRNLLLLTVRKNIERPTNRALKRLFDLAFSMLFLIVASPIILILGLLVKLDGGPAIYGHKRVGRQGRTFHCWKLRTMVVDADKRLKELLERDEAARLEWARDFKLRKDPRVTRLGNFLRVTGLDELPQLVNVLAGEMSIVGPRPVVEGEIERYGETTSAYFSVSPGITGLWQVSGRNDVDYETRVAFDQWYTRNWSLWLDLVIIFKTVPAVLSRRGAY